MWDFLGSLFDTTGFVPRWECGAWTPVLGWLHIVSDLLIWLAYLAIPAVLIYFIRRRRGTPFPLLFWLFGAFIVSCGFTHLMEVVTFYEPVYRLSALVKIITVVASWATVIALVPITPKALALRTSDELEREIAERKRVEQRFRTLVEAAPDALLLVNEEDEIVLANSQARKLFGYREEELLGQPAELVLRSGARDKKPVHRSASANAGPMSSTESFSGWRKDGSSFPAEIRCSPLQTEEGVLYSYSIRDITRRKQAEKERAERAAELARSEEANRRQSAILRLVLDSIGDGVVVADERGKFSLVNPAARQILGISGVEGGSKTWTKHSEIFQPDQKTPYPMGRLPLVRAVRGEAVDGEEMFVRPAAAPAGLWVSASGRPLKDDHGQLRGGVVVFRDITERKVTEGALRQRANVLQLLHAAAAAANQADNVDQAVQTALDRVCENTGWPVGHAYVPADDGSGELCSAHIWHRDEPGRFEPFRQATEARRFAAGEGLPGQVLAGGKPVWIKDLGRDLTLQRAAAAEQAGIRSGFALPVLVGKEVAAVLEFFTTEPAEPSEPLLEVMANVGTQLGRVVERQRLAQALREREELSRSIIETANEAFVAIDARGLVIDWNRQAELTFGWPRQEIVGRALADVVIPPKQREAHRRGMKNYFASGEGPVLNKRIELAALHRRGHEFPVELTIAPLRLGQTCRFNAFIHDISERKQAEEKVRSFANQLERSNRELQEFAFVASHDLQEPLRKIQAFGDRLQAKHSAQLDLEGRDYLQRMLGAAGRMQALIDGLLTYSRVSSKAQPFAPVDLGRVAREVLSDLESRIQQCGGRVQLGELPTIEADAVQMRQLLQNLIGNGLKFHKPQEPPVIQVQARLLPASPVSGNGFKSAVAYCTITVQDNGIGFDERYRDRIFQVFQRLHGRSEYEGTGMGLAICRRIAERHHGWITAKSTPGQGATFIVTLPVKQPTGEDAHEKDPRVSGHPHGR